LFFIRYSISSFAVVRMSCLLTKMQLVGPTFSISIITELVVARGYCLALFPAQLFVF